MTPAHVPNAWRVEAETLPVGQRQPSAKPAAARPRRTSVRGPPTTPPPRRLVDRMATPSPRLVATFRSASSLHAYMRNACQQLGSSLPQGGGPPLGRRRPAMPMPDGPRGGVMIVAVTTPPYTPCPILVGDKRSLSPTVLPRNLTRRRLPMRSPSTEAPDSVASVDRALRGLAQYCGSTTAAPPLNASAVPSSASRRTHRLPELKLWRHN